MSPAEPSQALGAAPEVGGRVEEPRTVGERRVGRPGRPRRRAEQRPAPVEPRQAAVGVAVPSAEAEVEFVDPGQGVSDAAAESGTRQPDAVEQSPVPEAVAATRVVGRPEADVERPPVHMAQVGQVRARRRPEGVPVVGLVGGLSPSGGGQGQSRRRQQKQLPEPIHSALLCSSMKSSGAPSFSRNCAIGAANAQALFRKRLRSRHGLRRRLPGWTVRRAFGTRRARTGPSSRRRRPCTSCRLRTCSAPAPRSGATGLRPRTLPWRLDALESVGACQGGLQA